MFSFVPEAPNYFLVINSSSSLSNPLNKVQFRFLSSSDQSLGKLGQAILHGDMIRRPLYAFHRCLFQQARAMSSESKKPIHFGPYEVTDQVYFSIS